MPPKTSPSSPHFKTVFIASLAITLICLVVMISVAFVEKPNHLQENLFEYCKTVVTAGVGAIFGLIGGKLT